MSAAKSSPIRIFYSYSHRDERLRQQLETNLALLRRQGLIDEWHDRKIEAGDEWKNAIDQHLESADIILLLISADFLASEYCYGVEMTRALEKHDEGARVIPIILHPVDWRDAPFGALQALPTDGKPITGRLWKNQPEAWADVARGIRRVISEMIVSKEPPERLPYHLLGEMVGVDPSVKLFLKSLEDKPFAIESCIELVHAPNYKAGWSPEQIDIHLESRPLELIPEFSRISTRWRIENPDNPDKVRVSLRNIEGSKSKEYPWIRLLFQKTRYSDVYAIQQILDHSIEWDDGLREKTETSLLSTPTEPGK